MQIYSIWQRAPVSSIPDQDEYAQHYNGVVSRYEVVNAQFDEITQTIADKAAAKS